MELEATKVFEFNWREINSFFIEDFKGSQKECKDYCDENDLDHLKIQPETRWIVNQGGSRSSKNYSIAQALILFALQNPGEIISVLRKNRTTVKDTAMKDYIAVMKQIGVYKRQNHNLSNYLYTFDNGSIIEFFGADNSDKLMGRHRTICHISEATEFWEDDVMQLMFRTTKFFVVDFNPKEASSWVYDLPDKDKKVFKSTYHMNPFLTQQTIDSIEFYKETDMAMYTIYALGERAETRENIYTQWNKVDSMPEEFNPNNFVYAVDFGFVHPTALVKIFYTENSIYIEDLIYESGLRTPELMLKMKALGLGLDIPVICETARPEIIADMRAENINSILADKSFKAGLDAMRSIKVYTSSENVWKEYQGYKWKKVAGKITEEVVKIGDDIMDAVRYGNLYIKKYHRGNQKTYTFR